MRWRAASLVLFFFSSRRRHTRLQGDWSSDVCSSDLVTVAVALVFSIVAVTVATPALTAVASPLDDTVTTSGCVEAQVAPCPPWVEPLRRLAVTVSWTAPPTAMVTSPGVIDSAATFVVFPAPPRPMGVGLHGVLIRLASCALLPAEARVTS